MPDILKVIGILALIVLLFLVAFGTMKANMDHVEQWSTQHGISNVTISTPFLASGPFWHQKGTTIYKIEGFQNGTPVTYWAKTGWGWTFEQQNPDGSYTQVQ